MAEEKEFFDPSLQRVVKVKLGDVVIIKCTRDVDREQFNQMNELIKAKLGDIPFLLVDNTFEISTFRPEPSAPAIHIA